jgi:hypothetical protein
VNQESWLRVGRQHHLGRTLECNTRFGALMSAIIVIGFGLPTLTRDSALRRRFVERLPRGDQLRYASGIDVLKMLA